MLLQCAHFSEWTTALGACEGFFPRMYHNMSLQIWAAAKWSTTEATVKRFLVVAIDPGNYHLFEVGLQCFLYAFLSFARHTLSGFRIRNRIPMACRAFGCVRFVDFSMLPQIALFTEAALTHGTFEWFLACEAHRHSRDENCEEKRVNNNITTTSMSNPMQNAQRITISTIPVWIIMWRLRL